MSSTHFAVQDQINVVRSDSLSAFEAVKQRDVCFAKYLSPSALTFVQVYLEFDAAILAKTAAPATRQRQITSRRETVSVSQ